MGEQCMCVRVCVYVCFEDVCGGLYVNVDCLCSCVCMRLQEKVHDCLSKGMQIIFCVHYL